MPETVQDWLANERYMQARTQLQPVLQQAADAHGVPVSLLDYLVGTESRWGVGAGIDRPGAAGELGLFQQTPAFRQDYGVSDPLDPNQQADAAARALRRFYDRTGDWGDTLIGYNRGAGGLNHYLRNERDLTTQPQITANYRQGYDAFMSAINTGTPEPIGTYSPAVANAMASVGLPTFTPPASDGGAIQWGMMPTLAPTPEPELDFSYSRGRAPQPLSEAAIEAALGRIDNA